ncbi:MAG: diguanylate cyclase, partial [Methylococcus sp.]
MADYKDILFQLSASFINLSLDQFNPAIAAALGTMGQFVDADRAYVFWHDLEAGTTSNTHEWCGPGISPQIDCLQSVPLDSVPDWVQPHSQGQVINVPDVGAMPESPLRDLLASQEIRSLISLPMIGKNGYQGFVGFDSVRQHRFYSEEEVRLLGLFANLLVSVEERRQAEQAIADSEERLRLALEAANQGMFDLDLMSDKVIVSPEYARMLGHEPDSFQETRSAWLSRVHPDDQVMVLGVLEDYLHGRTTGIRVEYRQRTITGEWKWVLCLARIKQWSADGRPVRLLGTQTDITELREASEQIHRLAFFDSVTELPNRSLMLDRLQRNLARIGRLRQRAGLMVLGLDHFKDFNATQGHAAGDRLLCDLAQRLLGCVGPTDTVARLGGDEFVILIDVLGAEADSFSGMEAVALRILEALREPFALQGPSADEPRHRVHHVDASLGVVVYQDQALSAEELLKNAETAMYAAKAAGGNVLR